MQCTERSIKLLVIVPQKHLERGLENDENADLYLSLKNGESEAWKYLTPSMQKVEKGREKSPGGNILET